MKKYTNYDIILYRLSRPLLGFDFWVLLRTVQGWRDS